MKQSNNIKGIAFQPLVGKTDKLSNSSMLVSNVNPQTYINKSSSQANYYNPAVHLKKNFLKFTKAVSTATSQQVLTPQIAKQQQVSKRQQPNLMMDNNMSDSIKFLKDENRILQQKISFLENECENKQKNNVQKDLQLAQLLKAMDQKQRQIYNFQQNQSKLTSMMNYYKSISTKCQICIQTLQKNKAMTQKYDQMLERCSQLEKILQSKDSMMQNNMKAKNDQYKSVLASKNNQIKSLDLRLSVLQKENQRLYEQLAKPNVHNEEQRISKFQKMGQEFQLKINQAINQNAKLRSLINNLQGKIEQLHSKNASLQNILKAYEDSQQLNAGSRARSELELLRQALQKAKQQYDQMISKYQFQILRLQNKVSQQRLDNNQSLLGFSDSERLRQALMNAIWEIQSLKARGRSGNDVY